MKKLFLIIVTVFFTVGVSAKVTLPYLMSDGMVLQQQTKVNIWGEASGSKKVTVTPSWNGKSYTATADRDGGWIVQVETPSWGGPYTIEISDGDKTTLRDVMIGEVWVCSGQSNMNFRVQGSMNQPHFGAADAIFAAGRYPQIRSFMVPAARALETLNNTKQTEWKVSTIHNVPQWSAVAYSFARHLTDALGGVPVGIITSSYGGSRVECWINQETIDRLPPVPMNPLDLDNPRPQDVPTLFYNAMLYPLIRYTAKGFLWYQGESNKTTYKQYPEYVAAMVDLWRTNWGDSSMPFYCVQLAPYGQPKNQPLAIPLFVEAQIKSVGMIPHSGIAATTDVGEEFTIHPGDKEPVGQRLAILALNETYGVRCLTPTGPIFKEVEFEDGKAFVTFENAAYGVGRLGLPIRGFEIAGADRKFYPADATVQSGKIGVWVSSPQVPQPVAVRYAFKNWPDGADMINSYGLPAFPFRTDDWDDVQSSL